MASLSCTNSSSIWARRMVNKSAPCLVTSATSWTAAPLSTLLDDQVELNVLSLLLGVPISTLSSPSRPTTPEAYRPTLQHPNSQQQEQPPMSPVEMHTAQTAVKAALDVLLNEDVAQDVPVRSQSRFPHLRISTSHASLSAPLSPLSPGSSSFDSPLLSPAESCFSSSSDVGVSGEDDEGAEPRRKGRARMSQEKRKRLARRREREAALLLTSQQQPFQPSHPQQQQQQPQMQPQQLQQTYGGFSRSAPVSPVLPGSPFDCAAGDSFFFSQNSAYVSGTSGSATAFVRSSVSDKVPSLSYSPSVSPPSSAGSSPVGPMLPLAPIGSSRIARSKSPSPPTLVVQPPSPQRMLLNQQQYYQHRPQQPFFTTQPAYRV